MLDIDIKLLTIFQELARTRSVSRAAESLAMAQPTVSIALGKLRKRFGDPLFVRTSRGMEPTPLATELLKPVGDALGLLAQALRHHIAFDPRASEHGFRICMTDISQIVLLPRLLNHLRDTAPAIRIDVLHITEATPRLLESGEADLAIGFMPQLEAGFYQQTLFTQRYVCMMRADHPRIAGKLGLRRFLAEAHIQVTMTGTGHRLIDQVLEERGVVRRIALRLPNFLGLAAIVGNTDLLVTVPALLGQTLEATRKVKTLKLPVDFPPYAVKQHWHERFHHDPRNRWLRGVVAELFAKHERLALSSSPPRKDNGRGRRKDTGFPRSRE